MVYLSNKEQLKDTFMTINNYIYIITALVLLVTVILLSKFKVPAKKRLRRLIITFGILAIVMFTLRVALFPSLSSVKSSGEYKYNSEVIQLNDQSRTETYKNDGRCRKLSVIVYYPNDAKVKANSCPLVVFSHGGISNKMSNVSLFKELATHGFVVVSIDHPYHSLYTKIDGKTIMIDSGYMKELQNEDSHSDIAASYQCYQKWMRIRTGDINFVIDTFIAESSKTNNSFYSLVNCNKIGVIGHSLGGAAALGIAHQRSDIKAVIALESPYMCDITGFAGDEFTWNTEPYHCAIMNIYSDNGYPLIESDNKYVQNKNYLFNEANVEYYYVKGSNHFTLTDLVRKSPFMCSVIGGGYHRNGYETLKFINEKSLAFFNKHLVN